MDAVEFFFALVIGAVVGALFGAGMMANYPPQTIRNEIVCEYLGGTPKDDVCVKNGVVISTERAK